jgi:heme/copper-type cytochrome/quinol oxidase subunit 3
MWGVLFVLVCYICTQVEIGQKDRQTDRHTHTHTHTHTHSWIAGFWMCLIVNWAIFRVLIERYL